MFGCGWFPWTRIADSQPSAPAPAPAPEHFHLPAPIPGWSQGQGFASGRIILGDLELLKISKFEPVWCSSPSQDKKNCISFYKPVGIPAGFFSLGHYCQTSTRPLHGFVLAAREATHILSTANPPALQKPSDYTLVWSPGVGSGMNLSDCGYFWLPQPPKGYKATGYLVTGKPEKPNMDEVRCVRADLTDRCETHKLLLDSSTGFPECPFRVWTTRPSHRGMLGRGVSVGTFFCSSHWASMGDELCIACLKSTNMALHDAMPSLAQIHTLINQYGPRVFFHPDETYLPSSVSWFFKKGALLYRTGGLSGVLIDANGSNLPAGGSNDGEYWIDLPCDDDERRESTMHGDLESTVLYVHVKPAMGGVFTDIAMWVFCPFNGPVTLKVGIVNMSLSKIGEHVCDWEHFTLRISNFSGELWSVYFSQHSGGEWVDAPDLEYIEGNRCAVYSSKSGHASFPCPGCYIQGSTRLGVGVRNDAARSDLFVDSSTRYEIVAAEYLGEGAVPEPCWLQFMREWGPTVVYNSTTELDKLIKVLPSAFRYSVENVIDRLPVELYGEEGPTGPKEKNNWVGDERS